MSVGRAIALAALAAVVPACHDGDGDDSGRFVLFLEDFSSPTLSPVWLVSGQGIVVLDNIEGTPFPSLSLIPPNGPALSSIRVTTDQLFTALAPLTFSVNVFLTAFPTPLGSGTAGITIFDPVSPSIQASALFDAETFTIQFSIGVIESPKIPDSGGFHTITFIVNGAGTATWMLDGVVQLVVAGFPAVDLTLSLRNDSDSVFNFDSIFVASP